MTGEWAAVANPETLPQLQPGEERVVRFERLPDGRQVCFVQEPDTDPRVYVGEIACLLVPPCTVGHG